MQWFVVSGTLRESDLASLLEGTAAGGDANVTLDLCNLQVLTPGGCWTIRTLADELWAGRRGLIVVSPQNGRVGDVLRSTGIIEHPRIAFEGRSSTNGVPELRLGRLRCERRFDVVQEFSELMAAHGGEHLQVLDPDPDHLIVGITS